MAINGVGSSANVGLLSRILEQMDARKKAAEVQAPQLVQSAAKEGVATYQLVPTSIDQVSKSQSTTRLDIKA